MSTDYEYHRRFHPARVRAKFIMSKRFFVLASSAVVIAVGGTFLFFYFDASRYVHSWRKSPEERAIDLARKYVPPEGTAPIEDNIKQWLMAKKGILRVDGWNAKRIDDQTYVAGYTYDEGPNSTAAGWVFEVNLNAEIVRPVIGDAQLEQRYADWAKQRKELEAKDSESSSLGDFSWIHWVLAFALISTPLPVARILRRAGRSPAWAFFCFMPVLGWIGLWVFSFTNWPALNKKTK